MFGMLPIQQHPTHLPTKAQTLALARDKRLGDLYTCYPHIRERFMMYTNPYNIKYMSKRV